MTFGSLFSGIGGLDLGLERTGMECKWQVEKDPYCRKVLDKHWPDVPKFGDIREIDFTRLQPVDLICGGFPCQPFSSAGKREGNKDERFLWPEFARAIREHRPRFVLLENVPGLLSMPNEFGRILAELASIGFDAEWSIIPAALFGAPHLRFRVFIVGYSNGSRWLSRGKTIFAQIKTGDLGKHFESHLLSFGVTFRVDRNTAKATGEVLGQPLVYRNDDGVSPGMDRVRVLGNAVVPQVAEWIGHRIMEAVK